LSSKHLRGYATGPVAFVVSHGDADDRIGCDALSLVAEFAPVYDLPYVPRLVVAFVVSRCVRRSGDLFFFV